MILKAIRRATMPRIPAIACLLVARFFHPASVVRAEVPKLAAAVEEALQWLPPDSESLIVSQGPFLPVDDDAERDALTLMRPLPIGLIFEVLGEHFRESLKDQRVLVAVEGSRKFRSPKGLGGMPFEGCQILRFEESADEAVRIAFRDCAEKADSRILLADRKVAIFKKRLEDDEWNLHVALPRNGLLLCATDREYLKAVLQRMNARNEDRAFPRELLGWQHVNVQAPVWGIRHYRRETAEDDPSSPFAEKAPANLPDPKAIGFTFSLERDSKSPRMFYLSRAPNARELAIRQWDHPAEGLTAVVNRVAPTVIEISPQVHDDGLLITLLLLLQSMGHAVYL